MAGDVDERRGRRTNTYTVYYSRPGAGGREDGYTSGGERGSGYRGGGRGGGGGIFGDLGEDYGPGGAWRDITPRDNRTFSDQEKRELLIATGILTLAFALAFNDGVRNVLAEQNYTYFAITLLVAFIVVSTAFVLHEMGHKFAAQRYGCWAEFRYSLNGLLLALVLSGIFGFLFAAPGAVMISGRIDKRQNGIISLAGPAVNLVLAYVFIGVLFASFFMVAAGTPFAWLIVLIAIYGININLFLGLFNMIPFPPLDGSKIITWNPGVYILLAAALGGTLFIFWFGFLFA